MKVLLDESITPLDDRAFAASCRTRDNLTMVVIRFPNPESKKKALGFLPGRFGFKSWATGEMMVPEMALAELALEGITFSVEGPAK